MQLVILLQSLPILTKIVTDDEDIRNEATSERHWKLYKEDFGVDFELDLGMIFDSAKAFRNASKQHVIRNGYAVSMGKNTKRSIHVACKNDCGFKVVVSKLNKENTF